MNHDVKVRRIKRMLAQIAGPSGLEAIEMPTAAGKHFESIGPGFDQAHEVAEAGLQKLKEGKRLNPQETRGLEAIIIPDKRPVVFIRNNKFTDFTMPLWKHLNSAEVHSRLEVLFPSIGRVELPTNTSIPYGGTAFVVGANLLMTNRHVARLFTDGLGTRVTYLPGGSAVDFKREDIEPAMPPSPLQVTGILMVHPYWDMALLKVVGLPESAKPLQLSTMTPEALIDRDVVVVGYPARDIRNDLEEQDNIFEKKYGVKRMQPGQVRKRSQVVSFENTVNAMTHDSSTLGGNSGSAVIDVETGQVVGLHFAGEYLLANYAVPTHDLAQDSRVVDADLNFLGKVAATTTTKQSWNRAEGLSETPPDQIVQGSGPLQTQGAFGAMGSSAKFVIPLNVTISLGAATMRGAVGAAGAKSMVPAQAGEVIVEKVPVIFPDIESRKGYQADFLSLGEGKLVPMPKLTEAGQAITAKLDDGSRVLNYHKFSVVLHKKRRLALFTAANVDWRAERRKIDGHKPTRDELDGFTGNEKEDWVTDPRIPLDHQIPDYFYTKDGGAFDKGHLVRRDDVAWGGTFKDMQKGNGDTFHTTNCSPQTAEFNRSKPSEFNWGALEAMVQKATKTEKVCVFSGPVLDDGDQFFHGLVKSGVEVAIQIPSQFWKIIVANDSGQPAAYGFVLDQDLSGVDLRVEFTVPDAWKEYMRPISEIEELLGGLAELTVLKSWDQYEDL